MKSDTIIVKICATVVGIVFVIAFFFWLSYGKNASEQKQPSPTPGLTEQEKQKILKDLSVSPTPLSEKEKKQILKDLQTAAPSSVKANGENIGGTQTLTAEQKAQILRDLQK